ncbi:MAG: hypothetical protein ACK4NR_04785 [Micavibrio sp.]
MGGLVSKPKAPAPSPVQYVYLPSSTATTTASADSTAEPATTVIDNGDESIKTQARQANLLDRRRGRLGTVLTSFRGLLNDAVGSPRKTLLGE